VFSNGIEATQVWYLRVPLNFADIFFRLPDDAKASFQLDTLSAFSVFLAARVVAAIYSPIQDCDEVYNYWEPTHYLNHGHGMQTWEYSPAYAIRSWSYIGIHALAILPAKLVPIAPKVSEFYFLRLTLASACAACEARLFAVIQRILNPRIAIMFLVIMTTSTGMFHASAAYLPSSFAMYTTMLGMAAFMDWRGDIKTGEGIMWIGIGGVLGWPFAMAMIFPYLFEELILTWALQDWKTWFWRLADGVVRVLVVLGIQTSIDSFLYKRLVCVPWNIVRYNIFSGSKGPNIYGTEPWDFYLRNLALNFNIWFVLALSAMPLAILHTRTGAKQATKQNLMRGLVFVAPMYIWLVIFCIQPHKEERFMYPAYPALALNAAFSLHVLLSLFGTANPQTFVGQIPAQAKLAFVGLPMLAAVAFGLWRAAGMVAAYTAPLSIYTPLRQPEIARSGDYVCLGKEWYRFPSSYHLPQGVRVKFVKSEFTGLLPGEFREAGLGFGIFPGTWLDPPGMNDENREDPGKYVSRHLSLSFPFVS
jgi:alpha-1,2-mannosyltransferase